MPHQAKIYQLKITLKHIHPPIWRRIQVKADVNLQLLHYIIQEAMGWTNSHLHQFVVDGEFYSEQHDDDWEMDTKDSSTVKLNSILSSKDDKISYEYDFGDGWEHEILLEKILSSDKKYIYPVCLTGKRACPPEDCGGIGGYEDLIETLSNPKDPEHQEMCNWLGLDKGSDFDLEEFDLEEINAGLKKFTDNTNI
jgi:hypothetical protein